jgi:gamma-glutamylcyclotransferase (GGCT)/AIG2-like uncharacterized protein YtfP
MKRVFVYGTLKKGFALHGHLQKKDVEFLGEAVLEGADLVSVGWYPGVVPGDGQVYGELYGVSENTLRTLDMAEGSPFLFKRETQVVKVGDVPYEAEVFFYQRATGKEEIVKGGVWK